MHACLDIDFFLELEVLVNNIDFICYVVIPSRTFFVIRIISFIQINIGLTTLFKFLFNYIVYIFVGQVGSIIFVVCLRVHDFLIQKQNLLFSKGPPS